MKMRAVRMVTPGKPLELQTIDLPPVGPNDVLVRVKAAGICHSDVHYRAGRTSVRRVPLTLGHEVAGVIESVGARVSHRRAGDRVCVHYMAVCGSCTYCQAGTDQFCSVGEMIGKDRDGGYAEFIVVPETSAFVLPEEIAFEHGAIMMCSSATSLHALNKARLRAGETVAVFGIGGLGSSAVQLAKAAGASAVYAVDIHREKLRLAEQFGAVPVDAGKGGPVEEIRRLTGGRGVDVALELIGLPLTMKQAVECLALGGRAALAGITEKTFDIAPYRQLINREAEIIGVADHLASELPVLLDWARQGKLKLANVIARTIPLEASAINETFDRLDQFGEGARVVIHVS